MLDYVRVIDLDTGHQRSVHEAELPHGNYKEVLTEDRKPAPAVNVSGEPLPPVYGDGKPVTDPDAVPTSPYNAKGVKKGDLETEVDHRNATRTEDDQIAVGGAGTVAELVHALESDDAAHQTTPGLAAGSEED